MMNTPLVKSVYKAIKELNLQPFGFLEQRDDQNVFIFGTELAGYKVTGALRIEAEGEASYNKRVKFAVCSDDDIYKPELGIDIALGRVMRMNQPQATAGGDLNLADVTMSFLTEKLNTLESILSTKRQGESLIRQAENTLYQRISDNLEEFV